MPANIADTIPPQVYLSGGTALGQALLRSTDAGALSRATQSKAADIASADTVVLTSTTGSWGEITGTVAITGVTLNEGSSFLARFTGVLTLTHGASLILPGAASITTAAGDWAFFVGDLAGVTRVVFYSKADGTAVVGSGASSPGSPLTVVEQLAHNITSTPSNAGNFGLDIPGSAGATPALSAPNWILIGNVSLTLAAATFAASRNITLECWDVTNGSLMGSATVVLKTPITTALTQSIPGWGFTMLFGDPGTDINVKIRATVSTSPSAGNLQLTTYDLMAIRVMG